MNASCSFLNIPSMPWFALKNCIDKTSVVYSNTVVWIFVSEKKTFTSFKT